MDCLTFLIIAAFAGFIASAATNALFRKEGDQTWESVAEDLDLGYTRSWSEGKRLYGLLRGFGVQIDEVSRGHLQRLRVEISGLDPGFTLGRNNTSLDMLKPDIETGDSILDERTRIEGDPDWALALLSDEARRLVQIVISDWDGELRDNTLSASYDEIGHTASTLGTLLDLAEMLRQPSLHELPKLLLERACHDPSSSVRLQAFRRLASTFAPRKETLAAAETLFDSPSDSLRFEACRWLVKSSSEKNDLAAEELAALATRSQAYSSTRRSAIEALAESRRSTAIPTMNQILQEPNTPPAVRTAALEGLIRAGAKKELLEIRIDGEAEAEILARGLGHFDVSVQPRLLQLLEDPEDRVRLAAVKSLGRVGDLDAIRALRQVVGQEDHSFKSALVREVEHAIDEIKGRSGGSQHGEISIVEVAPLEGAISPSDDDSEAGGEVSLTS